MKSSLSNMAIPIVVLIEFLFAGDIYAEDPVFFKDALLKTTIEDALWITDPTPTDMLGLTQLTRNGIDFRYEDEAAVIDEDDVITNLTGLEYALNLQKLSLRLNRIKTISALSGLSNLQYLDLSRNFGIKDLSPLAGLTQLEHLDIHLK